MSDRPFVGKRKKLDAFGDKLNRYGWYSWIQLASLVCLGLLVASGFSATRQAIVNGFAESNRKSVQVIPMRIYWEGEEDCHIVLRIDSFGDKDLQLFRGGRLVDAERYTAAQVPLIHLGSVAKRKKAVQPDGNIHSTPPPALYPSFFEQIKEDSITYNP